ncbi:MAG: hypothetical protein GWO87_00050 [Xanthomonadaceae bacterium]|nr:hypothetical protein [Rhodospirillaceae bacterium]NIA17572.1 hypothetical protein [Xanthomonadaceae bacterium]
MLKQYYVLEKFYFFLNIIIFFLTVSIIHLIKGDININDKIIIQEEYAESFFIMILFIGSYLLFKLYKKEMKKIKINLDDAFKYIGKVNVQLQEIEKNFTGFKKFPENKKEFKNILKFFAGNALSIVNSDWVLIRIIDVSNLKTLREYAQARGNSILLKSEISNKMLVENKIINKHTVVTSSQNNLGLKTYFIFPLKKISKEQKILIKTIINESEMMFIIFSSKFYKK